MIELITGTLYICIQSPVGPKGKLELGTRVWPYSVLLVLRINALFGGFVVAELGLGENVETSRTE